MIRSAARISVPRADRRNGGAARGVIGRGASAGWVAKVVLQLQMADAYPLEAASSEKVSLAVIRNFERVGPLATHSNVPMCRQTDMSRNRH